MKKILSILLMMLSVLVSGCGITPEDELFNIYFFTANTNATVIESIYGVEEGTAVEMPIVPERPGFDFSGWYLDINYTQSFDFDVDVMPNHSIVLYAKWDVTEREVIYNLNGGEMTTVDYRTTFNPGESFVFPQARKTGYTFKGWFLYDQILANYPNTEGTRPGDVGIASLPSNVIDDYVIYAHWWVIKVVVTFKSNHPGGTSAVSNPSSKTFAYGTEIDYGTNFVADYGVVAGYRFIGWNTKKDGTGDWYYDGSIFTKTTPTTIYGQWVPE